MSWHTRSRWTKSKLGWKTQIFRPKFDLVDLLLVCPHKKYSHIWPSIGNTWRFMWKKQIKKISDFPPIFMVRGGPSYKNTEFLYNIWKWYINRNIATKIFMCYQYNSNSVLHYSATILEIPPTETNFVGMPKWWLFPS